VNIPVFKEAIVTRNTPDLFNTPTWVDDAMDLLEDLIAVNAEREILQEQRRLIEEELRTTSQRVNLFEKVKIPECKEHIRVIKIFLGDEQTASVARAKLAKSRSMDYAYKDEEA
jgi:V/A-type H+-transporting ATPase subunit D